MNRRTAVALAALLLLALPGGAQAQVSTPGPHGRLRAQLDCAACHTPAAWTPILDKPAYDHAAVFPLTGRHAAATCVSCHLDLRFDRPRVSAGECASCHVDVHEGRLEGECASCHNTTSFREAADLDQHARRGFPLTGAHLAIACESCHTDDRAGAFTALETECVSCHRAAYDGATSVDHAAAGLPFDCAQCHRTTSWGGAVFDHATFGSGFPLLGGHRDAPCGSCHVANGTALLVSPPPADAADCIACHRPQYEQRHAGTGFPVTCLDCHTVDEWQHAAFDHAASANGFTLVGRHQAAACSACHVLPGFGPLFLPPPANQDDCVACHRADYDREHAGSGFPLGCATCHGVDAWTGAIFDHDGFFPIHSGAHNGKWTSCADCHTSGNDFGVFTCLTCHVHSRTTMDDKHKERAGYVYDSVACLSCHPQGRH